VPYSINLRRSPCPEHIYLTLQDPLSGPWPAPALLFGKIFPKMWRGENYLENYSCTGFLLFSKRPAPCRGIFIFACGDAQPAADGEIDEYGNNWNGNLT